MLSRKMKNSFFFFQRRVLLLLTFHISHRATVKGIHPVSTLYHQHFDSYNRLHVMNIRVCPQDNGRTIQLAEESGLKWLTRWAFVLRLPKLLYDTWIEWHGLLFKAGIVTLLKVILIVTRERQVLHSYSPFA